MVLGEIDSNRLGLTFVEICDLRECCKKSYITVYVPGILAFSEVTENIESESTHCTDRFILYPTRFKRELVTIFTL